jgi:hypothetical protein
MSDGMEVAPNQQGNTSTYISAETGMNLAN